MSFPFVGKLFLYHLKEFKNFAIIELKNLRSLEF